MFAVAVLSSLNILAQHKNGSHQEGHFYSFSREIRERMTATSLLFCAPHLEVGAAGFFFRRAHTDVARASQSATCAHIHTYSSRTRTLIKQTCPFAVAEACVIIQLLLRSRTTVLHFHAINRK